MLFQVHSRLEVSVREGGEERAALSATVGTLVRDKVVLEQEKQELVARLAALEEDGSATQVFPLFLTFECPTIKSIDPPCPGEPICFI